MVTYRSHRNQKVCLCSMALICLIFMPFFSSFAQMKADGGEKHEVDATILQVDSHGVYVPGKIFYWDETQGKRSQERLQEKARSLRNSRATITYSIDKDSFGSERPLVVTIEASKDIALSRAPSGHALEATEPRDSLSTGGKYVVIGDTAVMGDNGRRARGHDSFVMSPPEVPAVSQPLPITREEISGFIQNLLNLNNNKALHAIMEHYGDEVDYYARGLVTRDHVRRDMIHYFNNWDSVFTGLHGEVVVIVTDERNVRIAKFLSRFHVRNSEKSVKGVAENVWTLRREDNRLKLVGVKQNVLSREVLPP